MDVFKLREQLVKTLIAKRYGGSKAAFARDIHKSPTTVSRWFMKGPNHKNIGEDVARHIEDAITVPRGYLVDPRGTVTTSPVAHSARASEGLESELLDAFRELSALRQTEIVKKLSVEALRASKRRTTNGKDKEDVAETAKPQTIR